MAGGRFLILSVMVALPALLMAAVDRPVDSKKWTGEFDHLFKKYTKHYFGPHFDWRWFKAQGIAESGLRPDARSLAGARGIMQILPTTYREIKESNPHFVSIDEPKWNIAAGVYYDRMLYRKWDESLPTTERIALALASYNAGFGSVRKAYRKATENAEPGADPIRAWKAVAPYAPRETRRYVRRIRGLMGAEQSGSE